MRTELIKGVPECTVYWQSGEDGRTDCAWLNNATPDLKYWDERERRGCMRSVASAFTAAAMLTVDRLTSIEQLTSSWLNLECGEVIACTFYISRLTGLRCRWEGGGGRTEVNP